MFLVRLKQRQTSNMLFKLSRVADLLRRPATVVTTMRIPVCSHIRQRTSPGRTLQLLACGGEVCVGMAPRIPRMGAARFHNTTAAGLDSDLAAGGPLELELFRCGFVAGFEVEARS